MKTNFLNVTFLAGSLIAGGACAQAESLAIRIPFAFTAGEKTLPAGDYTLDSALSPVLLIRGASGSAMMLVASSAESVRRKPAATFDTRGGASALASVTLSTGATYMIVPRKREGVPARIPSAMGVALTHP